MSAPADRYGVTYVDPVTRVVLRRSRTLLPITQPGVAVWLSKSRYKALRKGGVLPASWSASPRHG